MESTNITRAVYFADRLYRSLVLTRVCLEMSSTTRVTPKSIKRIEQVAVPE